MTVLYKLENHVATVTLARPEALNAVDLATEAELQRMTASPRARSRSAGRG